MPTKNLTRFSAVYCSGAFVPEHEAVTALALLFERVHLPNNIELLRAFVKKYRVALPPSLPSPLKWGGTEAFDEWLADLQEDQVISARNYLFQALSFASTFSDLYGEVFESDLFPNNPRPQIKVIAQDAADGKSKFTVQISNTVAFVSEDESQIPTLCSSGYVPVVGRFHPSTPEFGELDRASAKQLAALLAMKSIAMVLPRTRAAHPEIILEARHRLRDQLPLFWSSMLKTSIELKKLITENEADFDLDREATDLVDRTIRPAAIDLAAKLEKDRRDWFYRILSPVRSGLRLLVGNPPLSQQQLITNAMVLASDTCVSIAENMRAIEALKGEAGLSYLLDLSDILVADRRGGKVP